MKHVLLTGAFFLTLPLALLAQGPPIEVPTGCEPVEGSYIVVLKDLGKAGNPATPEQAAEALSRRFGGQPEHVYQQALQGFNSRMTSLQASAMTTDPSVAYIEQDCWGGITTRQSGAPWGLDRVDERDLPLDSWYHFGTGSADVHAYVLDTGIRSTHPELSGRVGAGTSITGASIEDCHGHGTHVAGILGATTYGMAKSTTIHPVVVVDCNGGGTASQALAGVDWVTANHISPAVANMSVRYSPSTSLDTAVRNSIQAGVTYVVGAGNESQSACNFSPGRVAEALTVGATDVNDVRASSSNFGTCVDLFAPGVDIPSACPGELTFCADGCVPQGGDISRCDGTSMASPHGAGLAARYLRQNPLASPASVLQDIVANSTSGRLSSIGTGSPNQLLYSDFLNRPPNAVNDFLETSQDTELPIPFGTLLGNDVEPDNDPLWVIDYDRTTSQGGSTDTGHLGGFNYTPPPGFTGTDSLTYTVSDRPDGTGRIDSATIFITVTATE